MLRVETELLNMKRGTYDKWVDKTTAGVCYSQLFICKPRFNLGEVAVFKQVGIKATIHDKISIRVKE